MGYGYTKNLKQYINSFRYAVRFNDLTVHELHALLNAFGPKRTIYGTYSKEKIEEYYRKLIDDIDDSLRKAKVFVKVQRFQNNRPPTSAEFMKWYRYAIDNNRSADSIKESIILQEAKENIMRKFMQLF